MTTPETLEGDIARARKNNQDRRAAVLSHDDLAKRLTLPPIGYAHPEQWNGYIPSDTVNPGPSELCRVTNGTVAVRLNQRGHYTIGGQPNWSLRRRALLDLSREAWERQP